MDGLRFDLGCPRVFSKRVLCQEQSELQNKDRCPTFVAFWPPLPQCEAPVG